MPSYCILQVALPGQEPQNAGILLHDIESDRLYIRLRRDWDEIADEDDADVLSRLSEDLIGKANEMGGGKLLDHLEDGASNLVQLTHRETVELSASFPNTLDRLYHRHLRPTVIPYGTHLPLYSLRAAAGRFGANIDVEEEGWVEAADAMRLKQGMFVAHVEGDSMEPLIPSGSLCVFQAPVTGTRQNKIVLAERLATREEPGEVTVKRYESVKRPTGDGGWEHELIRMVPLNSKYPPWELRGTDEFRVIAEFVRVLWIPE